MERPRIDFSEVSRRLKALPKPPVEAIVGIREGGVVPASLAAHQWDLPLYFLEINFRDPENTPRYAAPQVLNQPKLLPPPGVPVLLVDDVCVSGQTMDTARALLGDRPVFTLVLKGKGDMVLFTEYPSCVTWPWKG